jgi:uncharacterized protein (DUF1778 family)
MSIDREIPTHLNMRIDPKLRYLAELAARATRKSMTDYIEAAIWESFKTVDLARFPEMDEEPNVREVSPQERLEMLKNRDAKVAQPLSDFADRLWSEHPFQRLQLVMLFAEHLKSEEDETIWKYLFTRKDLKTKDGKLKNNLIHETWDQIKREALIASRVKESK